MQNELTLSANTLLVRLFGSPRIEGPNGALAGPATQRHRLALLAVLSMAPRGLLPRDRLLGLLWPETEMANARQLLNAAVHALRKSLGDNVLLTEGEALRLDASALRIDVLEFEQALKRGDAERAVELHTGPFLDGLALPDAVELEQWQERERDRLERLYHEALERRADEVVATGNLTEGVRLWRQRVAATPTDSRVVVKLMRILAQAGDRAGALQTVTTYSRLSESELGISPDREVLALAEQLRAQPAPARGSQHPIAPAEPVSVTKPAVDAGWQNQTVVPAGADLPPTAREIVLPGKSRLRARGLVLGAAALLVAAPIAGWMLKQNTRDLPPVVNSVAVLPFVDLSPGREQEHLAAGVAEGILNALANVPGLFVPARSSSFQFRGEDLNLQEVAQRLRVEAVLEGSVQLVGDRLRINAQLAHPRTGYQLFSKQYDGHAADIFELQDQIARAIIAELQVHLAAGADPQLVKPATEEFSAYNLYLRGQSASKTLSAEGLQSAVRYYEEAIRLDGAYAAPHAGLADAYVVMSDYGFVSSDFAMSRALAAVGRALQLDSASAEAHTALGHIRNEPSTWAEAEQRFRRAIQLRPSYAAAHMWLGNNLLVRGRTGEGLRAFQRASELDPLSPGIAAGLSQAYSIAGDVSAAINTARHVTQMAPAYPWGHTTLAAALAADGVFEEALAEAQKAVQLSGQHVNALATLASIHARRGDSTDAQRILTRLQGLRSNPGAPLAQALVHANLGEFDRAFALLDRMPELNHAAREWLRVNPIWKPLRDDARWPALLRRLGLEQ